MKRPAGFCNKPPTRGVSSCNPFRMTRAELAYPPRTGSSRSRGGRQRLAEGGRNWPAIVGELECARSLAADRQQRPPHWQKSHSAPTREDGKTLSWAAGSLNEGSATRLRGKEPLES